jgi:hypothetical protein
VSAVRTAAADVDEDRPVERAGRITRRPAAWAALFVLPYLVLMLAWAGSNPPGAAPDEPDHLVKALGMARLDIGREYTGPPSADSLAAERNASISRVVSIPAGLNPAGYTCEAARPQVTAACIPTVLPAGQGRVDVVTPLGAYPPFLYVPIGLVAEQAGTPYHAFLAARIVCVLMGALLLFAGAWHLVRWLGRGALLGAFVALTPMVVFTSAMVSLSGVELCASLAVAAVAVVALRRPESLTRPGVQLLLGGVGSALVLSRQLGAVTFGALFLLMLVRIGPLFFWNLLRRPRPALVAAVLALGASTAATVWWERTYDRPVNTGPLFDQLALGPFNTMVHGIVESGIGYFGWLDTPMPRWAVLGYVLVVVVLVGLAVFLGSGRDRWTLVVWVLATVLLAYVTYASVFYPVQAGLQGRHVLPFFLLVPLLAGVVVGERLGEIDRAALRRLTLALAVVVPVVQVTALLQNARRYAVGQDGPVLFLSSAAWQPGLGWVPWIALGAVGAVLLAGVMASTIERTTAAGPTATIVGGAASVGG